MDTNLLNDSAVPYNTGTNISDIYSIKLSNAIFDHFTVTRNVTSPISISMPSEWDYYMMLNANFKGNISAGNVAYSISQINSFKIKRRLKGTFEWATLKQFPVVSIADLTVNLQDFFCANFDEYEYAFVPITNNIEGDYITNSIVSRFDGVFLADINNIYKFYAGVSYGMGTQVQKIGIFDPFGRKYPIVVSNSTINYYNGSFSGTVLPSSYLENRVLDSLSMVKRRKEILDFLTNKKAKILKDWNGNMWLILVVGQPSVSFIEASSMMLANISSDFVEVGNANSQSDLFSNGLIEGV